MKTHRPTLRFTCLRNNNTMQAQKLNWFMTTALPRASILLKELVGNLISPITKAWVIKMQVSLRFLLTLDTIKRSTKRLSLLFEDTQALFLAIPLTIVERIIH